MQLLLNSSEEFGEFKGLGLIKGKVKTLKNLINNQNPIKLPNIGWQKLKFDNNNKFLLDIDSKDEFYHVHSYYCEVENNSEILSFGKFENNFFPNIICKKNIFGVQFHPEKSGKSGLKLIENFIKINYKIFFYFCIAIFFKSFNVFKSLASSSLISIIIDFLVNTDLDLSQVFLSAK